MKMFHRTSVIGCIGILAGSHILYRITQFVVLSSDALLPSLFRAAYLIASLVILMLYMIVFGHCLFH